MIIAAAVLRCSRCSAGFCHRAWPRSWSWRSSRRRSRALFGIELLQYVLWASRGFADPFAFTLLFAAILLVLPEQDRRRSAGIGRIFAGGVLLAAADVLSSQLGPCRRHDRPGCGADGDHAASARSRRRAGGRLLRSRRLAAAQLSVRELHRSVQRQRESAADPVDAAAGLRESVAGNRAARPRRRARRTRRWRNSAAGCPVRRNWSPWCRSMPSRSRPWCASACSDRGSIRDCVWWRWRRCCSTVSASATSTTTDTICGTWLLTVRGHGGMAAGGRTAVVRPGYPACAQGMDAECAPSTKRLAGWFEPPEQALAIELCGATHSTSAGSGGLAFPAMP